MKRRRITLLAFLCLLGATQVQAQTMYRCGSVYQDRPCDAGKGRALGSTGTAAPAARTTGVDAECAQRGRDSLKIVWSREGGATEERLLAEAKTPAEKRLVRDVYRRPGAASTVQSAVEADCVVEKQKAEEEAAKALAAALRAGRDSTSPAYSVPPPAAEANQEQAAERRREERAAADLERKKQQCARYDAQLDSLRAQERAGGDVRRMEALNEQRRSLKSQMSSAGC
jgi:hypothetical protein